jgi:tetratricopeptide (TPR) repeat protein
LSNYEVSELLKEADDFERRGNNWNALQCLKHVLEIDRNNVQGLYKKAIIYGKCKQYTIGIKYLDKVLKMSTFNNRKEALLLKSRFLESLGRYDEAADVRDHLDIGLEEKNINEEKIANPQDTPSLTVREKFLCIDPSVFLSCSSIDDLLSASMKLEAKIISFGQKTTDMIRKLEKNNSNTVFVQGKN